MAEYYYSLRHRPAPGRPGSEFRRTELGAMGLWHRQLHTLLSRSDLQLADGVQRGQTVSSPYSTPRPNRFDFGRPCASRPASARLPRQSDNSFQLRLWSRPAESFHDNPALDSKVVTSDSVALVYFCNRTPRPRAISGT